MRKVRIFLLIILFTPIMVLAALAGDVNNDGKVTSQDYILIRRHIMKLSRLSTAEEKRADMNNDNTITSVDYILIRKVIMGGGSSTVTPQPTPTQTPTQAPTPAPTPQQSPAEQICEASRAAGSVDYASFASLKQDNDDFYVIKAAHDCANKYGLPVAVTKGVYNIYKRNNETINVETSTNFNNSTINIHDEFEDIYNYMSKGYVYTIKPNAANACGSNTITGFSNSFETLAPGAGNYYVNITETGGSLVWQRNKGNGKVEQEKNKSDAYRVYNSVVQDPMFWNYSNSTINYKVCPIPADELLFQNAVINNITRSKCPKCGSGYMRRGIHVIRSNTKISNITHLYVDGNGRPISKIHHPYYGIFTIDGAANVTIESSSLYALTYDSGSGYDSTYDIYLTDSPGVTLNNVTLYNEEQMKSTENWGVMGSAGCKNFSVINSKLNRIDAHRGMMNLTVTGSTIGVKGITIVGTGNNQENKITISDTTWKYTSNLINLRHDYGTTWNGTITIKSSKVSATSEATVNVVKTLFKDNANYAFYAVYNPSKIKFEGLNVGSSAVTRINIISAKKSEYESYYKHFLGKKYSATSIKGTDTIVGHGSGNVHQYAD